jgi:DNA-binding transcriptional ArsR family regulator
VAKRATARSGKRIPAAPRLSAVAGDAAPRTSIALDRLIHERMRLAIVSALAVNESLSFIELRDLIGATDGNLSVHARKLEEGGYVDCQKTFEGRVPRTDYRLTRQGREALERYLSHMEGIIQAVGGKR